jgi:hypothetical protein
MQTFSRIDASERSHSAGRHARLRDSGLPNLLRATRSADALRSAPDMGARRSSGSSPGGKRCLIAGETR